MISNLTRYYCPSVTKLHPIRTQEYERSQGLGQSRGPMLQKLEARKALVVLCSTGKEDSPSHAQYKHGLQAHLFLSIA